LVALFEEAAFGEHFIGTPAFEFGDSFFFFDEFALVADGFFFEFEFLAFEETGDEFGDEFGWWWTSREYVVNFDEVVNGVEFFEHGGHDAVGDDFLGVDGGFGVDVDFFHDFVLGVQVG
jgi:hypothetical protein